MASSALLCRIFAPRLDSPELVSADGLRLRMQVRQQPRQFKPTVSPHAPLGVQLGSGQSDAGPVRSQALQDDQGIFNILQHQRHSPGRSSPPPQYQCPGVLAAETSGDPRDLEAEIRIVVEKMLRKLEKSSFNERRIAEREKARNAMRRTKERLRSEQGIERDLRKLLNSLIAKIEKQHERNAFCNEDGLPFVDHRSSKSIRGRRANVYKMRGIPCKEWFEVKCASLLRNTDFELDIKATIKMIRDQASWRNRPRTSSSFEVRAPNATEKRGYVWVSPEEYDGNWNIIHIQCAGS